MSLHPKKLWVDDFRDAPDDSWWEVRNVQDAIKAIALNDFTDISLDHDIENRPSTETFQPVAYFIGQKIHEDRERHTVFDAPEPTIWIHTGNPLGATEMVAIFNSYHITPQIDTTYHHKVS